MGAYDDEWEKDRMLQDHILIGMAASYGRVLLVGWGFAVAATAPTPGCQGPLPGRRAEERSPGFWVYGRVAGKIKQCCFVVAGGWMGLAQAFLFARGSEIRQSVVLSLLDGDQRIIK